MTRLHWIFCALALARASDAGGVAVARLPKGWHLPPASHYDISWCGGLRESPFLAYGDFDADGRQDFAAIGIRDKTKKVDLIVVLNHRGSSKSKVVINLDRDDARKLMLLAKKGPAIVREIDALPGDDKEEVHVRGDYFEVVYCGSTAVAYCWNHKKKGFETVATAD